MLLALISYILISVIEIECWDNKCSMRGLRATTGSGDVGLAESQANEYLASGSVFTSLVA